MKLASRQNPITGQRRPVVHRPGSQIHPQVPIFSGPKTAETLGVCGGGLAGSVIVGVGFGLGTQIEQIDVNPFVGFLFLEVLSDDVVDGGVGDGEERVSEGVGRIGDLGAKGIGDLRREKGRS